MHLWISHPRDPDSEPVRVEAFDPHEAHAELVWCASEEARRLRERLASLTPRYERARWERDLVAGMEELKLGRLRSALRMRRFADAEGRARELREARAELEIVEGLLGRLARSAAPDPVSPVPAAAPTAPVDREERMVRPTWPARV